MIFQCQCLYLTRVPISRSALNIHLCLSVTCRLSYSHCEQYVSGMCTLSLTWYIRCLIPFPLNEVRNTSQRTRTHAFSPFLSLHIFFLVTFSLNQKSQTQTNSLHPLQLVRHDLGQKYWALSRDSSYHNAYLSVSLSTELQLAVKLGDLLATHDIHRVARP